MSKFIKLHQDGKLCIVEKESICVIEPNHYGRGSYIYFKNAHTNVKKSERGIYGNFPEIWVDESTEEIWSMLN